MFDLLLPRSVAGAYPGHVLALWILGLVALAKAAMGLNCIFNGRTVAANADGVPLDSFGADGARTVISLFAIWGLCQLLFALISVVALARWRGGMLRMGNGGKRLMGVGSVAVSALILTGMDRAVSGM